MTGSSSAADALRPLLFGDVPPDRWPPDAASEEEPWSSFIAARDAGGDAAIARWHAIATTPGVSSRHELQAWSFLRAQGEAVPADRAEELLGVVCEVAIDGGHDVVATYADGTARYLNRSGSALVFDDGPSSVHATVLAVVEAAAPLVAAIPLREQADLPAPLAGQTRLVLLTPGGQHLGQGPDAAIRSDPMVTAVFDAATHLLLALVELAEHPDG